MDDLLEYIEVDSDATIKAKELKLGKPIEILELSEDVSKKLKAINYYYIWQLYVFLDKETLNDPFYMNIGKSGAKEICVKVKDICGFDIVENMNTKDNLAETERRVNLCRTLKFLR